jgi:hypothetical protein
MPDLFTRNLVNNKKLKKIVNSKKAIILNHDFIKNVLGYDDMRDFAEVLHNWGYHRDFTYENTEYSWDRFFKTFLKETYL